MCARSQPPPAGAAVARAVSRMLLPVAALALVAATIE